jgi:hypothetical protein
MTVKITKPSINVREELADLKKPTGIAGEAMLRAETPQEQQALIGVGRRNLIINGAMVFSQRNGTSVVTLNAAGSVIYEFDRWRRQVQQNGKLTLQQVTDAPVGFGYSIKATTASAISPNTGADYYQINQTIEGFNTAQLAYGTSSAKTTTLSFWVKSTLTGQWSGVIKNNAANRAYTFPYYINSPSTWEYKTVTIPGDTSGTWIGATNGIGLVLMYDLGTARTNLQGALNAWTATNSYAGPTGVRLVQNAGATWQITGVQLEQGKVATPFEHRSYGEELALCQRYLYSLTNNSTGYVCPLWQYNNNATVNGWVKFPVTMRAEPSLVYNTQGQTNWVVAYANGQGLSMNTFTLNEQTLDSAVLYNSQVNVGIGNAGGFYVASASAVIQFDAEL